MRITVKLTTNSALEVSPAKHVNAIHLTVTHATNINGLQLASLMLTPDQCGALIFGMEQALEVIDQRHKRELEAMRVAA